MNEPLESLMNAELYKLVADLEAARLALLNRLVGCDPATCGSDISSLADLQTALTAVREVLAAHEPRLGHGSESSL
jgi:predicted component of type VI protein secretion system